MLTKMNLKYYLRGLGIGIIVTALIMGIVTGGKGKALSDEEIIKRAEQLGMTMESDVLSEALPEAEEEEAPMQEDASAQAELQDNAMKNGGQDLKDAEAEAAPQEEEAEEGTEQQTEESIPDEEAEEILPEESQQDGTEGADTAPEGEALQEADDQAEKEIPISISGGEGSMSVCRKLQEAGLVASASEFDTFLCQNGYDKKLKAGDFEIPEQADPEQIARILCRME